LKFTLNGVEIDYYVEQHRPFYLLGLAFGTKKVGSVYTPQFVTLIDTGAGNTVISKAVMDDILYAVKQETGEDLPILGYTSSVGVHGDKKQLPLYCIPCLCLTDNVVDHKGIRLFDVVVAVSDSAVVPCLLGRTILQCCVLTLDPEENIVSFDFKKSLEANKPTMKAGSIPVYSEVGAFAEFHRRLDV
jgi:hypothetical protein